MTETLWSAMIKIFTIWAFAEKILLSPWTRSQSSGNMGSILPASLLEHYSGAGLDTGTKQNGMSPQVHISAHGTSQTRSNGPHGAVERRGQDYVSRL